MFLLPCLPLRIVVGFIFREQNLLCQLFQQETQLSPSDRAMRLVSSNLANYHATVQ